DIVREQFRIAAGGSIADLAARRDGYAMELRINAERAVLDAEEALTFLPSPGTVTRLHFPAQEGIILICGVREGRQVTPYYDSMIIQLIGHAASRGDVIARLRNYLERMEVRGVSTNIPLLKRVLDDEVFRSGRYDTRFLEEFAARVDCASLAGEMEAETDGTVLQIDRLRIADTDEVRVLSPTAGVFYRTASPGEPEFVAPDDVVDRKKTLCLLEAMKMFQPLTLASFRAGGSPVYAGERYRIVRVVPENGQKVNHGDLLFILRPERTE
ncbi:MAG TPA: carbamoyl-phosphate synthase large subunit, partial [Acidobacteriota bacterium]|nr:carbamoyl-phosphate synthase large subunit [Acidobacteriota bacterium]